jgi:hypothetical protein
MAGKGFLQRMPPKLQDRVEAWAELNEVNRTEAINIMCRGFLDSEEIGKVKQANKDLMDMILKLAMDTKKTLPPNMADYMY